MGYLALLFVRFGAISLVTSISARGNLGGTCTVNGIRHFAWASGEGHWWLQDICISLHSLFRATNDPCGVVCTMDVVTT